MLSDDVLYLTVRQLSAQIHARKISPVELTESYLARLEKFGPKLGAVATLTRDLALTQARQAEKEIAAGRSRGPLHGIPYGAKDLLATRATSSHRATSRASRRFPFPADSPKRRTCPSASSLSPTRCARLCVSNSPQPTSRPPTGTAAARAALDLGRKFGCAAAQMRPRDSRSLHRLIQPLGPV